MKKMLNQKLKKQNKEEEEKKEKEKRISVFPTKKNELSLLIILFLF